MKYLFYYFLNRYLYDNQYDKTLEIYLSIRKGDVFGLIHKHDLFSVVENQVLPLMKFDESEAIRLLINNTDRIPVSKEYGKYI